MAPALRRDLSAFLERRLRRFKSHRDTFLVGSTTQRAARECRARGAEVVLLQFLRQVLCTKARCRPCLWFDRKECVHTEQCFYTGAPLKLIKRATKSANRQSRTANVCCDGGIYGALLSMSLLEERFHNLRSIAIMNQMTF